MDNLFNSAQINSQPDEIIVEEVNDVVTDQQTSVTQGGTEGAQDADKVIQEARQDLIEVEIDETKQVQDADAIAASGVEQTKDIDIDNLETPPSTVGSGSSSVFAPFASALQEKGILNEEDVKAIQESENPADAIFEAYAKNQDSAINGFIEQLPDDLKYIMSNYKEGVPVSKLIKAQTEFEDASQFTEKDIVDNPINQEATFRQYYNEKGFTPERIEKSLARAKELGVLADDAIELNKELVALKASQRQAIAQQEKAALAKKQEEQAQLVQDIQKKVNDVESIIPGVKLDQTTKNRIYQNMTQPYKDNMSYAAHKRAENPVDFEMKLNYFIERGFFDENADFKSLVSSAKSQAVKSFEESLARDKSTFRDGTIGNKGFNALEDLGANDSTDWGSALGMFD